MYMNKSSRSQNCYDDTLAQNYTFVRRRTAWVLLEIE